MMKNKENKTIVFAVDKGGTGKTTTVLNASAGLARRGYKILAVDMDQQANLTETLLGHPANSSMRSALLGEKQSLPVLPISDNLDLAPSGTDMFGIGIPLIMKNQVDDYRLKLNRLLKPLRVRYDYIMIDCPPSDNVLMFNALYAGDTVVIVTKPEPYCISGAKKYCEIIRAARAVNKGLSLTGILLTDFEKGSRGHALSEKAIREAAPKHVFNTIIRHSRTLYNSSLTHQDIFSYAPNSIGAVDYETFITELINRLQSND